MSLSFSNLQNIDYTYPIPNVSLMPIAASDKNLKRICSTYMTLFKDTYTPLLNNLLMELSTVDKEYTKGKFVFNEDGTVQDDIQFPTRGLDRDKVSREGNAAYLYYLKAVVNRLRNFRVYITNAAEALRRLNELTTSNANDQAHVLLDKLKMYDSFCYEICRDFSQHSQYNKDSHTWNLVYDMVDFNERKVNTLIAGRYNSLDEIHRIPVLYIVNDQQAQKTIDSFNELSKMDKLKFIRRYYEFIIPNYQKEILFPNDLDMGYPCLANEESTSPTKATEELGALELFYVGYLVDRDGPINAFSTFLEVKTQALRNNISLKMEQIEGLNQALTFINRGLDLVNQSNSEPRRRIPDGAYLALRFLCDGPIRALKEINGEKYMVLTTGNIIENGYEISGTGRYILVKANALGLDNFIGTTIQSANELQNKEVTWTNGTDTSDGLGYGVSALVEIKDLGMDHENVGYWNLGELNDAGASCWQKVTFYHDEKTFTIPKPKVNANEHNVLVVDFGSIDHSKAIAWLPKMVPVDRIKYLSVKDASHDWIEVVTDDTKHTNRISSWTKAFTDKSQFINTAIETINNEVTGMRTKIDTLDSASSTFRNRAYDTYSGITSRIG